MRFVRSGDVLERDPQGRRPGRGAYLCRSAGCAEQARRRRAFDRSFRAPVRVPDNLIDLTLNG